MTMEIMTIAKPKGAGPKDTKPTDTKPTLGAQIIKLLILCTIFGLPLLFFVQIFSHESQFAIEREATRAEAREEQRVRRMYDPTEKEMKEDIRSIAKRTYPNSYKDQVIFERNMKDLYGLD